ncbi:unnamed protein product, partial [marine sediment metagenome]
MWVNQTCGGTIDITWQENSTGGWVTRQTNNSVPADTSHNWTFAQASSYSTKYWWRVYANASGCNVSATYHFTTVSNNVPVVSNPYPSNESTDVGLVVSIGVTVADADGHSMNITWCTNASGGWQQIGLNHTNIQGGTYYKIDAVNFEKYNTTYWWSVNVTDGFDWTNRTYSFTAEDEPD